MRSPKQLIKAIERHKAALAKHRDELRQIESEAVEAAEISEAAIESLEWAIDRLSEQF